MLLCIMMHDWAGFLERDDTGVVSGYTCGYLSLLRNRLDYKFWIFVAEVFSENES